MTKKKSQASTPVTTAIAKMAGETLVPLVGSGHALEKLPGVGGEITREAGVTRVTGRAYATRDYTVPASEIYFVDGAKPGGDGPWLGEADKVCWRDEQTGLECIMLRQTGDGFLCGYVGVPRDHPLWGWDHKALPEDLGIEVHGGLTYSRICDQGPSPTGGLVSEARRICDTPVRPAPSRPMSYATSHRPAEPHTWWFGFECGHVYDVLPGARPDRQRFLSLETGAEYRDDTYVVREILNLARQLRAIADGVPVPPREGPALPALGLDPRKGA